MFTLRLSFDEGILAFLGLATVLATFSKIWAIFSQYSGHPEYRPQGFFNPGHTLSAAQVILT
jgi:hypothetical protein